MRAYFLAALVLFVGCGEETPAEPTEMPDAALRMDPDAAPPVPDARVMDAAPAMDMTPPPADMFRDSNVTPPPDARPPEPDMAMVVDAAPDAVSPDMGPPPTCEDLECDEFSRCDEDPVEGARCVDLRCMTDRDCDDAEYCDEVCRPGFRKGKPLPCQTTSPRARPCPCCPLLFPNGGRRSG